MSFLRTMPGSGRHLIFLSTDRKENRPTHSFDPDKAAWPDVAELRIELPTGLDTFEVQP